jgi:hypothetical protein
MAHSIKNPQIIHLIRWRTYEAIAPYKHRVKELGYLCCNSYTKSKSTMFRKKVTCKNCLRKLKKLSK